ncbi:endonuclease/exonuclease/phosphatase family protein [Ruegeria conchae]|uniref:Endonuclease/exonuclease/phosphatase family metal-dependent hydrolase n=1 Tax=Ruegeria conchae TaxID=981384 RepID=A0A497ZV85_9RHOB|nr:GMP synthase [Ruegeria conchae]RLK10393.1 endonuclease/exonuclease/phosphatase family metal-dependent hydrolase [Ruegeria conchae]
MVTFSHSLVRIAVWNLAGFNPFNTSLGIPANSERVIHQIEGLALLDAELITLVEVSPIEHINRLAAGLADKGLDYQVKILQQPNGNIHIGFLHKPGVSVTELELIDGSEGNDSGGRQALIADVQVGKFKAKLIAVHLKSGRDRPEQQIRDSQCKIIGAKIAEIRATPGLTQRTILLMGDFNMIPGQDVSNFHHLGGDDMMDFVSCWDLQDRFSHILEKGRANLLDGFAVSRTYSTDYVRGSLRLFPMHWTMNMGREAFKDEVSDHLPFVASFRIF